MLRSSCFSEPIGVDFALSLEPVFVLVAGGKAAHFSSSVGEVADAAMPFRRGQPVGNQVHRPEKISLDDWRSFHYGRSCVCVSPWDPCCNFAGHKSSQSGVFRQPTSMAQHKCPNNGAQPHLAVGILLRALWAGYNMIKQ